MSNEGDDVETIDLGEQAGGLDLRSERFKGKRVTWTDPSGIRWTAEPDTGKPGAEVLRMEIPADRTIEEVVDERTGKKRLRIGPPGSATKGSA